MRKANGGGTTVAVLGSMTAAMTAQRALALAAIRCEIVKADSVGGRGCGYGVAFPSVQHGNVAAILAAARVNVRRYE